MSFHSRVSGTRIKRALGVQAALEWAFRVEQAQLELHLPPDVTEEGFGFGLEYVLLQRAVLGCKIDGGQHKIGGYTHEDTEVIAATIAGIPDILGGKRMAIRVAELARAGLTPDWMPGAVPRCVPTIVKQTELGGWDEAMLLEELRGLIAEDFDLGLIGIPEDELEALLHEADDIRAPIDDDTADTIPEAPVDPITRPGDIWALGEYRLICGDATDPAVVARLMDGAQVSLMFTSPPYAQQRDYGVAKEKVGDWDALMQGVFAAAPVSADAQVLVNLGLIHCDGEWIPYWVDWMRAQGWRRFGWYVLDQGPGLPGDWNARLAPSHEFVFHFNRQPRKPNKTVESKHAGEKLGGGGLRGADGTVHRKTGYGNAIQSHRIPDSVLRIMRHKGGLGAAGSHPAVFPVALAEAVLEAFTDPGDLVFEPFCGSGSQLIAAERTGRRCCAVELDPVYCDVAVRRWELATGRKAQAK